MALTARLWLFGQKDPLFTRRPEARLFFHCGLQCHELAGIDVSKKGHEASHCYDLLKAYASDEDPWSICASPRAFCASMCRWEAM